MARTPSGRAGSRTREAAPARRNRRLCPGALAAPVLAALCCALPGLARVAAAQQSTTIQATATVTSSYSTYRLQADSAATPGPAVDRHAQRLAIRGVGVLQVEGSAGAQVRLDPPTDGPAVGPASAGPGRPAAPRLLRATIAYFGS